MRVHPAVLLVLVALAVPVVVEARTMLVWVGVDLTVGQTVALGALLVAGILLWAIFPARDECTRSFGPL